MTSFLLFDVMHTVFQMEQLSRESQQIYENTMHGGQWRPMVPTCEWWQVQPYPDSIESLHILRKAGFFTIAMSNCPHFLLIQLSKMHGIEWDGMVPLDAMHLSKPDPAAFTFALEYLSVHPSQCAFVTGHSDTGDVEGAGAVGIMPQVVRNKLWPTLTDFADGLIFAKGGPRSVGVCQTLPPSKSLAQPQ